MVDVRTAVTEGDDPCRTVSLAPAEGSINNGFTSSEDDLNNVTGRDQAKKKKRKPNQVV